MDELADGQSTKAALRASVFAKRRGRSDHDRTETAHAIAGHLLAAAVSHTPTVATYLSMNSEPGTAPLIAGLLARGTRVIVPVVEPDHQLAWVEYDPSARAESSPLGVVEPDGARLGPEAIAEAGLIVVPALAVDLRGTRLGRGAGYYDRALGHATAPVCALLFSDELIEHVPAEIHDRPVDLVATEAGIFRVFPG
jgi:5-formyltetrahydrofolate cyclo-ligase